MIAELIRTIVHPKTGKVYKMGEQFKIVKKLDNGLGKMLIHLCPINGDEELIVFEHEIKEVSCDTSN